VHVEERRRHFAGRRGDRRAEADVRHEVAVHHVQVQKVRPPWSTSSISAPSIEKSAERIEGRDHAGGREERGIGHNQSFKRAD
jgi:hypothetical protein